LLSYEESGLTTDQKTRDKA